MSADEIISAIRTDNLAKLIAIPGVGRKTAERPRHRASRQGRRSDSRRCRGFHGRRSIGRCLVFDDALSVLVNLGYQCVAAEKALKQANQEGGDQTVQKLLRRSLQILAK